MHTRSHHRRVLVAVALGAAGLGTMSACGPSSGSTTPTTASVGVSHTVPSSSATAPCTGTASWSLTPVSLTGSDGDSDTKTWTSTFNVNPSIDGSFGTQGHACTVTDNPALGLRPGQWRFETVVGPYHGICTVTLHAGGNFMSYHEVTGCS